MKYKENKLLLDLKHFSKKFIKYFLITALCIHQLIFLFIMFLAFSLNIVNPKFTSLMLYRSVTDHQRNKKSVYIPLKHISKRVQSFVVGIEDYKFYEHEGIDPEAIVKAYNTNKRLGYRYSGGSTITQQLVRSLLLTPEKSYIRKYFEILIALEFELFLSKDRILELYINNIEFGKGVYGIGRASIYYYHKSYYNLSMDEINRLIAIIPNPRKYNPFNFYNNKKLLTRYIILTEWSS